MQAWRGVANVLKVAGPLTALIGYLNVLLEYFDFFKFSLAGHSQHLSGLGYAPASCSKNE